MSEKKKYVSINLPETLVEELKVWRLAFSASYGKNMSYADMIRGMLDSLQDSEPGVFSIMEDMVQKNPELLDKMGNYRPIADN